MHQACIFEFPFCREIWSTRCTDLSRLGAITLIFLQRFGCDFVVPKTLQKHTKHNLYLQNADAQPPPPNWGEYQNITVFLNRLPPKVQFWSKFKSIILDSEHSRTTMNQLNANPKSAEISKLYIDIVTMKLAPWRPGVCAAACQTDGTPTFECEHDCFLDWIHFLYFSWGGTRQKYANACKSMQIQRISSLKIIGRVGRALVTAGTVQNCLRGPVSSLQNDLRCDKPFVMHLGGEPHQK